MNKNTEDIFALILESQKADQRSVAHMPQRRDTFPSDWGQPNEGRLAVDVCDTADHIIVLAPMAGAEPEHVDVLLHDDMLSIRGTRIRPGDMEHVAQSYHEECYWGPFSRSIVLPVDVISGAAQAEFKHGLLMVRIPKTQHSRARAIPIEIVEE